MQRSVAVCIIAVAMVAGAGTPKPDEIDHLLRLDLDELAGSADPAAMGLASDHTIVVERSAYDAKANGAYSLAFVYTSFGGRGTHKIGKPIISVADGVAWYQVPYHKHAETVDSAASGDGYSTDEDFRAGGVAVARKDGKGWELVGVHFSRVISDAELMAKDKARNEGMAKPAPLAPTGDKALGAAVTSWIEKGFSGHATTIGTPIASGTAPAELASGKATVALVKRWDALGLTVTELAVHVYAGGKVGYAVADVQFPRKGKGLPIAMTLSIVALLDGDTWKWASLQFSA